MRLNRVFTPVTRTEHESFRFFIWNQNQKRIDRVPGDTRRRRHITRSVLYVCRAARDRKSIVLSLTTTYYYYYYYGIYLRDAAESRRTPR